MFCRAPPEFFVLKCKLTDNDLREIEGKGEKLLGLLQKKYGHLRDKTELEYKNSVELLSIVSNIREIMAK